MGTRELRGAPNGAKTASAEEWIASALDDTCQFTQNFLAREGWLVVPVESGQHFDRRDAGCIGRAVALRGQTKLSAVLLEDIKAVGNYFEVDATEQGLLRFSQECAHFNFALLPQDRSFAVICTTDDYYLVAGPRKFVEDATGKSVTEARADFWTFAVDDSWSTTDRERLVEVSRRYEGE